MVSAGSFEAFDSLKAHGFDLIKDHRGDLPDRLVYWVEFVGHMSISQLQCDQIMRTRVYDAFANIFSNYDLIVSPTTASMPVANQTNGQTTGPDRINGVEVDPLIGWCMTYMTNMIGHPSASVPAGLADGLPIGLQIIGRRHGDFDVMTACAEFERARPWTDIYKVPATRVLEG
jgi:amidase